MATIIGNGPHEQIVVSSKKTIPVNSRSVSRQPTPSHAKMSVKEKLEAGWTQGENCQISPCGAIRTYGKGADVVN